jgi:chorismate synthase
MLPDSVCVSIESAASNDTKHSMSVGISDIDKQLRRRRNKCVVFTQGANTPNAIKLWKGRLTQTKRASAMNALISNVDENNHIYEDTTDMVIFSLSQVDVSIRRAHRAG